MISTQIYFILLKKPFPTTFYSLIDATVFLVYSSYIYIYIYIYYLPACTSETYKNILQMSHKRREAESCRMFLRPEEYIFLYEPTITVLTY